MAARVLFNSVLDDPDEWVPMLKSAMPGLEVEVWPDVADPAAIDVALIWTPPEGGLGPYTGLKAILSLGAGVNQLDLSELPEGAPLARIVDPSLTATMVDYARLGVAWFARDMHLHRNAQREGRWAFRAPRRKKDISVGVMGLGEIGRAAAESLAGEGYDVAGWSRSQKTIEGVRCFAGSEGFEPFLARSSILVNVLALTAETAGVLDARAFAALPRGACVINEGRGGHVVEADLLASLEAGHVAGAMLDVFQDEPPPAEHPFWTHPNVIMTPHCAGTIRPESAIPDIVENIRRAVAGEPLVNAVDPARGY